MIVLILLTLFALLVLAFGFLGIKIPFVSAKKDSKPTATADLIHPPNIKDKLVKDSIEHTIRSTKLLKEKLHEDQIALQHEY